MAKRTDEARKLEKAMQKEAERLFKEYIKDNPDLEISGDRVNVFVEANEYPGHDIYQLPEHTKDGKGMWPLFNNI